MYLTSNILYFQRMLALEAYTVTVIMILEGNTRAGGRKSYSYIPPQILCITVYVATYMPQRVGTWY